MRRTAKQGNKKQDQDFHGYPKRRAGMKIDLGIMIVYLKENICCYQSGQ